MKGKVLSFVLDYDLYPRSEVDSQHVGYIAGAMASGAVLPPVIVDKKSRKVVDGFHRCKAALRLYGDDAEIECVEREYANEREMFIDAMQLNASHGARLDTHDRVHCWHIAARLRIPISVVASTLNLKIERFKEIVARKTATRKKTGEPIALKRTIESVASGRKLNEQEEEDNERLGGMTAKFYVNQVIILLRNDWIDEKDEKLVTLLRDLRLMLTEYLDG